MTLSERIGEDLKAAMKAGDGPKVSVLRMLKAAAANAAIQKGKSALEEAEILEVIQKSLKQHQESVDAFTRGGRADLAQKEAHEARILREYLPPQMGEEELRALIQAAIRELGVSGPSGMGPVMKMIQPKVRGRADGKTVSRLVAQLLQQAS